MSKSDQLFAEAKARLEYARILVARQEAIIAGLDAGDKAAARRMLAEFRKTLALFEQRFGDLERERERGREGALVFR